MSKHAEMMEKRATRARRGVDRATASFVRTPDNAAGTMMMWPYTGVYRPARGSVVLEPSAGDGALVDVIMDTNPDVRVIAVEPDPERAARINTHGGAVTVVVSTFEEYAAANASIQFDTVIMNPPFVLPGEPDVWVDHVQLAYGMLREGGRLAAVIPNGFSFRRGKRFQALRDLVEAHGGSEKLPAGSFASEGTGVGCSLLWMYRPMPTPQGLVAPYLFDQFNHGGKVTEVKEFDPSGWAAANTPIQEWDDRWGNFGRVLRYRAPCVRCGFLLWTADDGGMDPRGVLGDHSGGFCLYPEDFDLEGPAVALCPMCANTSETYNQALTVARGHWSAEEMPEIRIEDLRPDMCAQVQGLDAHGQRVEVTGWTGWPVPGSDGESSVFLVPVREHPGADPVMVAVRAGVLVQIMQGPRDEREAIALNPTPVAIDSLNLVREGKTARGAATYQVEVHEHVPAEVFDELASTPGVTITSVQVSPPSEPVDPWDVFAAQAGLSSTVG